ncbi:MAG: O-antigen ligase family protein [Planctomycetia bacterium]|nr:O-antigen ligase family protein [Planctomycetia bacterium]
MSAYRKTANVKRAGQPTAKHAKGGLRMLLLAAVAMLSVARPLLPSEGVSWLGDGLPFDMLWILIAGAYLVSAVREREFARKPGLVDAAVFLLVGLSTASAIVGARQGSPRLAINMLWEWVAFGLVFFLVRQLVRTAQETRTLAALMVALAVVLSSYGFYQVFIGMPAERAAYAENPDALLRSAGQWYPPGSPERSQFENRLQSTEPLATFALTNSLAGYLAPWLVVALGIGASLVGNRRDAKSSGQIPWWSTGQIAAYALCILIVTGCLLLTKSRSGYVAGTLGAVLLPICCRTGRSIWNWKVALSGGVAVVMLVAAAVVFKGLDFEVISEVPKSLGYRLQYWQATAEMIKDHPWLGVGPGNFQDYYTQYKLPTASEEIRDPHNFLLEVWATSGSVALAALGGALVGCGWHTLRSRRRQIESNQVLAVAPHGEQTNSVKYIVAGGAAGLFFAFVSGPPAGLMFSPERLGGGLLMGGTVVALLWPWVKSGRLPRSLPALGALVLATNLLAAGGIAYPGIAGAFWILLALALNETEAEPLELNRDALPRARLGIPWLPAAGLALIGIAAAGCYFSAYSPVLRCHAAMVKADDEPPQNTDAKRAAFLEAAAADSFSAEPWQALAELELPSLQKNPTSAEPRSLFVAASARLLELRPRSSSAWRQVGQWYWLLYEQHHDSRDSTTAEACYRRAVELYPHLAVLRGEYALALDANGHSSAAAQEARTALELDEITPHADKKLPPQLRRQLEPLAGELR